jgi:heme/copper-type cytochrome/quinol oxidase subunit 4
MANEPESHQDKMKMFWIIVVIAVILLAVYIWYTSGTGGLWSSVKKFLIYALILVVVGLIVFAVMKLLQKPKVDLVSNNRQDIIDAAILSKPPMVNALYLSGDKEHGEKRLGTIIGYCQLHNYKDLNIIAGVTSAQIEKMERDGEIPSEYIVKEDIFVIKTMLFPFSIFEDPKVIRVLEDEHSPLIGDVRVYAISLYKSAANFLYPNRAHLDIARIDITVIREAWRGAIVEFLRDQVSLQKRASGLDSDHQKELENRKLLKIPAPMGEQESRN